ncbi:N-acetylmuramoyl-L-alanine amidase [Clostridiales bacterium COT073_COT-073]|nr:N-acetylmuramoyl-L-alanine amidase [Clostridiales bacterium COT073_COT-073]
MNLFKQASCAAVLALVMMAQSQNAAAAQDKTRKQPEIYSVELKESNQAIPGPTGQPVDGVPPVLTQPEIITSTSDPNLPTIVPATQPVITAPAGPQITLPTLNLPVIWSKVKNFERVPEGPVEVPFWQAISDKTSIFGLNRWQHPQSDGNFYRISASNKVGGVLAEYRDDQLVVNIYNAKVSLEKSQTEYPFDPAISSVKVQTFKDINPPVVQMAFQLRPVVKDFVLSLDELGERILVEMITNAVTQISLVAEADHDILTLEGFQPLCFHLQRGAENTLELEIPSAKSLLQNQEAFVNARYISRMAVTDQIKGKTKIKLWLRENVEFEPAGQSIRFFPARTENLKYSYGILTLKRPDNFNMADIDYILDEYQRKASLRFPYPGYLNGSYWIGDNFITKIERMDERLHFTFPEVYELTIAEDRDHIYISAKKPKEIFTKVVFIDIGHGGNDPGAVRRVDLGDGYREYTEKEANFTVAMLLREKLKQNPEIRAYFSRLSDENPSAYTRAKLANEVGADFFLSLHNNMTTVKDRKIEGTDIYYLAGRQKGNLTAKNLAEILLKNYAATTSFANRLMNSAPHLYMVKYPQMPAVIVESGFMSDDGDLRKIFDPLEQEKTAEALYHSILEAFGYLQLP